MAKIDFSIFKGISSKPCEKEEESTNLSKLLIKHYDGVITDEEKEFLIAFGAKSIASHDIEDIKKWDKILTSLHERQMTQ